MKLLEVVRRELNGFADGGRIGQLLSDGGDTVEIGVEDLAGGKLIHAPGLKCGIGNLCRLPYPIVQNLKVDEIPDRQFMEVSDCVCSSHGSTSLSYLKGILA